MPIKVRTSQLKSRTQADLDSYTVDFVPPDSFARYAYDNKPYPALKSAHSASSTDKAECEKWGLTPEKWVEKMDATRLALMHDMKLDPIKKGISPAM